MNNLKNHFFKALIIAMGCLFQISMHAQTTPGISGATCISSAGGVNTATYTIELPGTADFTSFERKSFSVSGGIEIVNIDSTSSGRYGHITVRSLTDTERNHGYPKYRPGTITFSCEAPEDERCTPCPYYDPHFVYHYTMYKLFDLNPTLNPIVGPICVLEGDTVTYSVEPWVSTGTGTTGADSYRWELPAGLASEILYYSSDSSSITFVIDQLSGQDTIKAQIGRCNFGDPAKYTWLALNQSAPAAVIKDTSCIVGGVHDVQFWVENPQVGLTYTWSCDQPLWLFKNGVTGDTVTITVDDKNPATLTVQAAYSGGGCDATESSMFVTRSLSSEVSYITPDGSCFDSEDTQLKTFSLKEYPSGSTFKWTMPTGWTGDTEQIGTTFQIKPTSSAQLFDSVLVSVDGCETNTAKAYVYVKPGDANSITGETFCVEKDSTYTFSTTATSPAADSYYWTMPGWNITSGQGTLTITAVPTGTISTISVTPKGLSSCDAEASSETVSYPPTAPTDIVVSTSCINAGLADQVTFTATAVSGNYYDWNIDGIGSIVGSATGSTITVNTIGLEDDYDISVRTYTNNAVCPYSNSYVETVPIVKEDFTVTESVIVPPINSIYFTYPSAEWVDNHDFEWVYNGGVITNTSYPYSTNQTAFGLLSTTDSLFYVTVTNKTTGCITRRTGGVLGFRSGTVKNKELSFVDEKALSISPNPTDDKLTISLPSSEDINIWVFDSKGNIMKNMMNQPSSVIISVKDLSPGSYIIVVYQGKNRYSQQFIKK